MCEATLPSRFGLQIRVKFLPLTLLTKKRQRRIIGVAWSEGECGGFPGRESGAKSVGFYTGEFEHTIDDKGRVILPSKMRSKIGEHCYLTRGYNGCLNLYSEEDFHDLMETLTDASKINPAATVVQRRFVATDITVDGQGRLPLSKPLMDYSGIGGEQKSVVLVGTSGRIEIWAKDRWEAFSAQQSDEDVYTALRLLKGTAE